MSPDRDQSQWLRLAAGVGPATWPPTTDVKVRASCPVSPTALLGAPTIRLRRIKDR
jgi:hypothetical protein